MAIPHNLSNFDRLDAGAQALICQIQDSGGFDISISRETHSTCVQRWGTVSFLLPYDHAIESAIWEVQCSIRVYKIVSYIGFSRAIPRYGYVPERYGISNPNLSTALSQMLNIIRTCKKASDQVYEVNSPEAVIKRMEAKIHGNTEHATDSESCRSN